MIGLAYAKPFEEKLISGEENLDLDPFHQTSRASDHWRLLCETPFTVGYACSSGHFIQGWASVKGQHPH